MNKWKYKILSLFGLTTIESFNQQIKNQNELAELYRGVKKELKALKNSRVHFQERKALRIVKKKD